MKLYAFMLARLLRTLLLRAIQLEIDLLFRSQLTSYSEYT